MNADKGKKIERVLTLYTKLIHGNVINKEEEAQNYGVNERSIQRDIEDIRIFFENDMRNIGIINSVIYDRSQKGYKLKSNYGNTFTTGEILALCKILLGSRVFIKIELQDILTKLINSCISDKDRKTVDNLIKNEQFHYIEPHHNCMYIEQLRKFSDVINQSRYIEIEYMRSDRTIVKRRLKPVGVMFSESYFYLAAFIDDGDVKKRFDVTNDKYPTIYRIDRIKSLVILDEHFHIPYTNRFQEGEFRKRILFMHAGRLTKVTFEYTGQCVDVVLDKIPTAKILSEEDGIYMIEAEVFEDGFDMWIRSQGDDVKIIEKVQWR